MPRLGSPLACFTEVPKKANAEASSEESQLGQDSLVLTFIPGGSYEKEATAYRSLHRCRDSHWFGLQVPANTRTKEKRTATGGVDSRLRGLPSDISSSRRHEEKGSGP